MKEAIVTLKNVPNGHMPFCYFVEVDGKLLAHCAHKIDDLSPEDAYAFVVAWNDFTAKKFTTVDAIVASSETVTFTREENPEYFL